MTRRRIGLAVVAALGALVVAGAGLGAAGDLTVVSLGSSGSSGNAPVEAAAVSADGRYVAFTSAADMSGVPVGGLRQLYVRDRVAGTTALASSSATGAPANAAVDSEDVQNPLFAISGDGRYVVFATTATNLTPADTDAAKDVYRKDLVTGAVVLVSVNSNGVKANAGVFGDPATSYDGSRVCFGSGSATNLFGADANGAVSDIVVRDIPAGTTTLAAVSPSGVQANGTTERCSISADGRAVAFDAPAGTTNLAPNDTGAGNDVYVRNLAAGTTTPATDPSRDSAANFNAISGDGRFVVFESGLAFDPVNDTNPGNDVYRRDMVTGAIVLVSARDGQSGSGNGPSTRPVISADGSRVAFASTATDLTASDTNGAVKDVFVRDVAARTTRLVSVRADGTTQSNVNDSDHAAIAANGGAVTFVYNDAGATTKLVPGETNAQPDALLKELVPTDLTGPSVTLSLPADGSSVRDAQAAVAGTATDPSGVASVTVNGNAVPLGAAGGFATGVPLSVGPNAITVAARDGSGNLTTKRVTVTRVAPSPAPPRLVGLKAAYKKGRIVVTVRLNVRSSVRLTVLRRPVARRAGKPRKLRRVGRPLVRSLPAGQTVLTLRRHLGAGRYVLRVQIVGASGSGSTRVVPFRVPATRRPLR